MSEPNPRIPRSEVRRRILAAAADVFVESGYAAASLAGIARRAGFTKGAVYSNFASKQELFAELLAQHSAETTEAALAALLSDPGSGPETLAERAGAVLAREVARSEWATLVTELGVQAIRDPEAATAYTEFRRRQRISLAKALRRQADALGISGADFDRAAVVLQATIAGLSLERAVDPAFLDDERAADMVAAVVAGLMGASR